MKIRYASDLHVDLNTEYYGETPESIIEKLNLDGIDVLVLAGDTAEYPNNIEFVKMVMGKYPNLKIVEIPGNHLYYSCAKLQISMNKVDMACKHFADLNDNYSFINKNKVKIGDVTFIGCIMWTKLGEHFGHQYKIQRALNDFRYILKKDLTPITPMDIVKRCQNAIQFIRSTLNKTDGKCIVITHHAPFFEYHSDISHAFGIDLATMIGRLKHKPECWIYGHTHINKDVEIEGVKCVTNQFGYKGESEYGTQFNAWKTFNANAEIEV